MEFEIEEIKRYLEERSGATVEIDDVRQLGGEAKGATALKQFGYGRPFLVSYRVGGGEKGVVFHRIRRNAFGRGPKKARSPAFQAWEPRMNPRSLRRFM
jgi:hypothetical protein